MRRVRSLWLRAWPLWSVRMSAIGAILTAIAAVAPDTLLQIWNGLPDEVRNIFPERLAHLIPTLLFAATIVVRLIPQKPAAERRSVWKSISGKVAAKKAGGIAAAVLVLLAGVIAREGGYVNHPADPGGETNMGITKVVAVKNGYTGPMRTLPREVAESIYYSSYLVEPGYAALVPIDAAVTEELFDTTVNMGAARPSTWFQLSINAQCSSALAVDGRVGPGTIAAYDGAQRLEYARLVRVNPKLQVFYKGWIAQRVGNVDRRKCKAIAA
jgi:hypothetical protein